MRTSQDITAARGLSDLQRRVLAYARQAMLAKGQTITEPKTDKLTICLPAPKWLQGALVSRLNEVMDRTKRLFLGGEEAYKRTRWGQFFNQLVHIEAGIREAAQERGIESEVNLTSLVNLVIVKSEAIQCLPQSCDLSGYVEPIFERGQMIFRVNIAGIFDLPSLRENLEREGGWIESEGCPSNCTIPELLRDLYGFPVRAGGHIDGLAFSQADIGKERYNRAQAALRRACVRLWRRRLIGANFGAECAGVFTNYGARSGIGLTSEGVEIADALLAALSQFKNGNLDLLAEDVERSVERLDVATLQDVSQPPGEAA